MYDRQNKAFYLLLENKPLFIIRQFIKAQRNKN